MKCIWRITEEICCLLLVTLFCAQNPLMNYGMSMITLNITMPKECIDLTYTLLYREMKMWTYQRECMRTRLFLTSICVHLSKSQVKTSSRSTVSAPFVLHVACTSESNLEKTYTGTHLWLSYLCKWLVGPWRMYGCVIVLACLAAEMVNSSR